MLSREQILSAPDRAKTVSVSVPEWGGDVRVAVLTAADRDQWEQQSSAARKNSGGDFVPNWRARLCALCMVDEAGKRLFTDADVAALGAKSAVALDRVHTAAFEINALGEQGVRTAAKNCDPGLAEGSSLS